MRHSPQTFLLGADVASCIRVVHCHPALALGVSLVDLKAAPALILQAAQVVVAELRECSAAVIDHRRRAIAPERWPWLGRYHRLLGQDVFFMTGADEHGL